MEYVRSASDSRSALVGDILLIRVVYSMIFCLEAVFGCSPLLSALYVLHLMFVVGSFDELGVVWLVLGLSCSLSEHSWLGGLGLFDSRTVITAFLVGIGLLVLLLFMSFL